MTSNHPQFSTAATSYFGFGDLATSKRSIEDHIISCGFSIGKTISRESAWNDFISYAKRKIDNNDLSALERDGINRFMEFVENNGDRIAFEEAAFTCLVVENSAKFAVLARFNASIRQLKRELSNMVKFINDRYGCDVISLCISAGCPDHKYDLSAIDTINEENSDISHFLHCVLVELLEFKFSYDKHFKAMPDDRYLIRMTSTISNARKYYIIFLECIAKNVGIKKAKKTNEKLRPTRLRNWMLWQQEAEKIKGINPTLSREAICKKVAEKFGVSPRSVRNHLT